MKLSIIVPCHNLEKYIHNLLNSFDNQKEINWNDFDLIFVLDDCTDNTEKIIKDWLNNRLIFNHAIYKTNNHSAGLTRNVGKDNAIGDYIWFIDGDDWLYHTHVLNIIINLLKNNPSIELLHIPYKCNVPQITAERSVWQYIFKKDLINNIKFTDKIIAEDTEFLYTAFNNLQNKSHFMRIEDEPMYFYWHNRPGSVTTKYIEAHPELFQKEKNKNDN